MPGWLYLAVFSAPVILLIIGLGFWIKDKLKTRRRKAPAARLATASRAPSQPWQPLQEYSPQFHDQVEAARLRHTGRTSMRTPRPTPAPPRHPRGDDTPPAA